MTKKLALSTLIILILASILATTAFAQEIAPSPDPNSRPEARIPKHAGRGMGVVTDIGTDSFTIETPRGVSHTLLVTSETVFRTREGEASFDDLFVGGWVAGIYTRTDDGLVALKVLILPEDFDPGQVRRHIVRGEVWSVDLTNDSFTVRTPIGEEVIIFVDQETAYRSRGDVISGLADLQPHMRVVVYANLNEDGLPLAKVVAVTLRTARHAGKIQSVDVAASTFDLLRRDGQTLTFQVTDITRFKSSDGSVGGLEDLQAGMQAVVSALALPDGNHIALLVGVRIP